MIKTWKDGENAFAATMAANGYIVTDVSKNPDYFDIDVDFLVYNPNTRNTRKFEVKTDFRINETQNLYLEVYNNKSKGGKGWFRFCEADYIVYIDAIEEVAHIILFDDLRTAFKKLGGRIAYCRVMGDDSSGYTIKLSLVPHKTINL